MTAPPFIRESTTGRHTVRPARSGLIAGFGLGILAVLGVTVALVMSRGARGHAPAVAAGPEPVPSSAPASTAPTEVVPAVAAPAEPSATVAAAAPSAVPSASAAPVASASSSAATSAQHAPPPARPPAPPRAPASGPPKKKDLFGNY